jgi:Tfp pilus assembly protein PilN
MRAVNLLPQEARQRRAPNKLVLVGVSSSTAVLLLVGAGYYSARGTVNDRQQSLADVKAQLAAMPKPKSHQTSAFDQELAVERTGRLAALSTVLSSRVRWDRLLREIAMVLPDDVWLQQLNATAPEPPTTVAAPGTAPPPAAAAPAPTSSGTTFSIQGNTYTQEGVARLLVRLQLVPDLENVTLVSSTLSNQDGQQQKVQFTINADVRPPQVGS